MHTENVTKGFLSGRVVVQLLLIVGFGVVLWLSDNYPRVGYILGGVVLGGLSSIYVYRNALYLEQHWRIRLLLTAFGLLVLIAFAIVFQAVERQGVWFMLATWLGLIPAEKRVKAFRKRTWLENSTPARIVLILGILALLHIVRRYMLGAQGLL